MKRFYKALCAAALVTPLVVTSADAQFQGGLGGRARTRSAPNNGGSSPPPNVGPQGAAPQGAVGGGGGGGFRGDGGFRGGGGFRGDGFRGRDRFYGSIFIGPSYGYYDPFWWPYGPYGYGYSYYPPPRYVDRGYGPPPDDYLIPPGGPPPEQNWYHCRNPEGFYPYVRECNDRWEAVPAAPPPDGPPPPRQGG